MHMLLIFAGCGEGHATLTRADRQTIIAVMENNCHTPWDCTFSVGRDGRVYLSPPPRQSATLEHKALRLPRSSPIYRTAIDFGCLVYGDGTNDDCSLTAVPEEMPYIRLTLTRRYSRYKGGESRSMTWRVDTEHNIIEPLADDT